MMVLQSLLLEMQQLSHCGTISSKHFVIFLVVVAFSSLVMILRECTNIHSLSVLFNFFLFEVEISLDTLIPIFMPGSIYVGSVSKDNCSVAECFSW